MYRRGKLLPLTMQARKAACWSLLGEHWLLVNLSWWIKALLLLMDDHGDDSSCLASFRLGWLERDWDWLLTLYFCRRYVLPYRFVRLYSFVLMPSFDSFWIDYYLRKMRPLLVWHFEWSCGSFLVIHWGDSIFWKAMMINSWSPLIGLRNTFFSWWCSFRDFGR